jgi:valyl-tRNA synthetase
MDAKLTNPAFMAKAKEEAIEEARERKSELEVQLAKLSAAVKWLDGAG